MKYRVYLRIETSFEIEATSQAAAEEVADHMADNMSVTDLVNEHEAVLGDLVVINVVPEFTRA